MKINRDKLSKYFARFGLIIMSFVIMIPMLCSMAFPVTITISNPDNIPYEYSEFALNNDEVTFGSYPLTSSLGFVVTIQDNVIYIPDLGLEIGLTVNDYNLDGSFIVDYVFTCATDSTASSYVSCSNNDISAIGVDGTDLFLICVGDYTSLYVQENEEIALASQVHTFVLTPYTPPTDSITNVWTGIMNWITSSFNTVQGIFITGGVGTPISTVLDFNDSVMVDGTTFYHISPDYTGDLYYNGILFNISAVNFVQADGYSLGYYDGLSIIYAPSPISDSNLYMANMPSLTLTAGQPYQLTLLGTLAVIGLSIALGFFILGVIQRFLRLRG